jgi:hypothetical protein
MSNARRRLWARSEPDAPPEQNPNKVVDRLSEYASGEARSYSDATEQKRPEEPVAEQARPEQPVADQESALARAEIPADLSAVGDEVGAVLSSAQEAANRIREAALEEAAKRRDEAEAAVVAKAEEARRVQDDADAYAAERRAEADAHAERRRQQAERESATIMAEARSRLEAADDEAERKLQEADAKARAHYGAMKAEAERYEERLENISVVFHQMSAQLDGLLRRGRITKEDGAETGDLDETLRPDASTLRGV